VGISNGKQITAHLEEARFFLEPINPLHRQYEALRAYFVEGLPSAEAAGRFGYTPGAFRVLCHKFRHEHDLQERFFRDVRHGPQAAPARDPIRELVVAMRKKNLSVYDIQHELMAQGHEISINALSVLLREEGFARLPRRRDEERPSHIKPVPAQVADVRHLDLAPRTFRTRVAGLFLFVPLMKALDLGQVAGQAQLPGSELIPPEQALRALLALKLIGKERKSHVMNLVFDEGLALFAGLNVMPKRPYLAAYSSSIGERGVESSRAQARATLGGEFPICALSVAQRDPSSTIIHVSCALSKIPYVGFSPVRLQEQVVQVKPATDSHPLKPYPTYRFRRHLYFTLSSDHNRCTYTRQLCFCRLRQCPTSASACS